MGRYTDYMRDIWAFQANRKIIGLTLFGVLFDNSRPFTPGDQLQLAEGVETAVKMLSDKGYDFLIISGQPANKTKNLEIQDFENILAATKDGIEKIGGRIKNAYYAPSTDKNDPFVKPNIGMFERAQSEGMIKWNETYYIGSDVTDIKAAAKIKTTPILIKSKNSETKIKAFELTHQIKVKEFDSLLAFANSI